MSTSLLHFQVSLNCIASPFLLLIPFSLTLLYQLYLLAWIAKLVVQDLESPVTLQFATKKKTLKKILFKELSLSFQPVKVINIDSKTKIFPPQKSIYER